jgi:hypothetical protein
MSLGALAPSRNETLNGGKASVKELFPRCYTEKFFGLPFVVERLRPV